MPDNLQLGDEMPYFQLQGSGEGTISSTNLKGRNAVIYFYPKDDTPGCTREAIAFSQQKQEFLDAETEVIGISADLPAKHDKFIAKHNLTIALGSDPETLMLRAFGVWVQKAMYGKHYMGIERATFLFNKQSRLVRIWRKVKVAGHVSEVLKQARGLT